MKVLWFCNIRLSDVDACGSGSWLDAMARGLAESERVELGVIAPGPVRHLTRSDCHRVKQWLVPGRTPLRHDGLPPDSLVRVIVAAAKDFSPDLIHVWGTELYWGLLPARGLLTYPALLEMQGLKGLYAKVFLGGLTLPDRLRCIGIKELLTGRMMRSGQRHFARWRTFEEEIIRGHRFVDAQSPWVASHIKAINPTARLFPVDLPLRQRFYDADAWQSPGRPSLLFTAPYPVPYKGLHVAIRALSLLTRRIPGVRLRIAGAHQRPGIRQDGYMRWINRMVRQLGLNDVIDWLGPLDAENVVTELKNAAAVVIPTFIETYCVALAEAMRVGTPTVVSYTGGTAHVGKGEDCCLFFPPGDEAMCAYQLERVLTDEALALRLSRESRQVATVRNDSERIVRRQLEIYRQVAASRACVATPSQ